MFLEGLPVEKRTGKVEGERDTRNKQEFDLDLQNPQRLDFPSSRMCKLDQEIPGKAEALVLSQMAG